MNILGFGWRDHKKEQEAMAKKSEQLAKEKLRDNALELLSYLILETDSVCFPYKFPFERKAKALLGEVDLQTMVKNLGFEDYGGLRERLRGILKKSTSIEQTMKQVKDSISLDKIVIERQEEVKKPMAATREFMLKRLIKMKQETGSISEKAIKQDPLLSLYEIQREFGDVERAKKIVKAMMREQIDSSKSQTVGEKETVKNADDFKEVMKVVVKKQQNTESAVANPKPKVEQKPEVDVAKKDGDQVGRVREYRYEDVYCSVAQLAKSSGRIPTEAQIREQSKLRPDFPSPMTVTKHLGNGWQKEMAEELGLTLGGKLASTSKKTTSASEEVAKPEVTAKPASKISETNDATQANSPKKATPEKELSKDWVTELNHEYGIKIDKVVKSHEEITAAVSETLEAITSASKAFSEFEASKMLQYDMEGGGTTMIYILSSK